MFLKKLKNLKTYSVLIVPEGGCSETTSYKVTTLKAVSAVILLSVIIFFISALILRYTPVGDLFYNQTSLSSSDRQQIEDLKTKMIFLARELESLRSANARLRYAIMLGDSNAVKALQDSSVAGKLKEKTGGSLFAVFTDLFLQDDKKKDDNKQPEQKENAGKDVLYYFYTPANGYISRQFVPEKGHFGIDYVLKPGSPVYAAANGYVVFANYTVSDGYMIIINHANDYITVYKHCSMLIKKEREKVLQGDLVALSGNSGRESAGPHLHFEIWKNGQPLNPEKLLLNN